MKNVDRYFKCFFHKIVYYFWPSDLWIPLTEALNKTTLNRDTSLVFIFFIKAMCHIHVETSMVSNWFPNFLRACLFFCLKKSRLLSCLLATTPVCYITLNGNNKDKWVLNHIYFVIDSLNNLKVLQL